jgi:hypothetical protein
VTSSDSQSGMLLPAASEATKSAADEKSAEAENLAEPIGSADAEEDAAQSGGDLDLPERDTPRAGEGEAVGRADAEADAARSGADPDQVGR